ncbi:hypothetical protein CP978_27990 [Streptomyces nodosus]|uniref:Membrane protein n=1 Tax=Streptomyces nodosus TaxID=40318 RepID=A0A0B5DJK1_9ACTN|nr:membrane protein [Streptomyces nodosus]QEV43540.1 hypothetical protein CP978_27990 [Streptomyces nodosus]
MRHDEWPTLGQALRGGRHRIHGCVWAVILFPCTWMVTLPLLTGYAVLRSARTRARRIFPTGHRRIMDPEVMRVQRVRAWTAVVVSLFILLVYGKPDDFTEAQTQFWLRPVITPWLLLFSAPAVVAVLYASASPEAKRAMRPCLRRAGRSALWYVGVVTLIPLLFVGCVLTLTAVERNPAELFYLVPFLYLAVLIGMVWAVLFLVFASGSAVRSGFNTSEVHAALPALLTGLLVWELTGISLAMGGLPPGPPLIRIAALVGGPASVTAVAWWEIHRLRTRHGVTLRA